MELRWMECCSTAAPSSIPEEVVDLGQLVTVMAYPMVAFAFLVFVLPRILLLLLLLRKSFFRAPPLSMLPSVEVVVTALFCNTVEEMK